MKIFGLEILPLAYQKFFEDITLFDTQKIVFTPNPEICLQSLNDPEFLDMLRQADILTTDGVGLYIGYQIQENSYGKIINTLLLPYFFFNLIFARQKLIERYGERICGSDLTLDIIQFAQENIVPIAIIDLYNPWDSKKVASQQVFSTSLSHVFPKLKFDYYIYNPSEKQDIIQRIKKSDAQILFSTLGMKSQEASIIEVMNECKNIKLGLWVGSSFDYITGFQKRAPEVMRRAWVEWLYRIFTSPWKYKRIKRIFQAVVVFPMTVILKKK